MKAIGSFSIICTFILAGCAGMNYIDAPYIQNENLSKSYKKIGASFIETRAKLLFSGGNFATDCKTYIDLISKYDVEETIHNQMVKSEYLVCDALNILSDSSGISNETVSNSNMGEELLFKLDIRSFPSSLSRAGNEKAHTLKKLFPGHSSYTDNIAKLITEDWSFIIEVVAVARINNNSYPDWIVWISDESIVGNYRGYSTLIVYDPGQQDTFIATTYP